MEIEGYKPPFRPYESAGVGWGVNDVDKRTIASLLDEDAAKGIAKALNMMVKKDAG